VATFFKPASQKAPEKLSWRTVENSLIIGRYDPQTTPPQTLKHPVKIAAFDLDDTVISPTGAKFARSAQSWKWWDPSVPGRLKSLYEDGYLVAIFSNQGNVSLKSDPKALKKDTTSLTNLKEQLSTILGQIDLPISMYGATGQDRYRKPRTGMWEELLEDYDLQSEGAVDLEQSFYVGDAAGRAKTDKRKKDFASSDRELAANIGIKFHTPDEFFLDLPPDPFTHDFHPVEFLETRITNGAVAPPFAKKSPHELVIFCGSPGSGKSTFYWQVLQPQGYERINQDLLKTRDRCLRQARDYLQAGDSVAVGMLAQGTLHGVRD
jgi:bifunctional polynucleotide phosphatase/kinase